MDTERKNYWLRKRLSRRRFMYGASATVAGAAGIAAVGCGDDDDDDTTQPPTNGDATPTATPEDNGARGEPTGNLRVSVASLMDQSPDPFFQTGGLAQPVSLHAYNSFFRLDDDAARELDLAEDFELSEDRQTAIFKLRPGVKFWDGSDMTAEDTTWSYEAYVNRQPPNPAAVTMNTHIESVEATDESTIVVNLVRPTPFQTREIGFWPISSRAYYESVGEDEFRRTGMGTGPFRITQNRIGEFMEMEAFTDHWNPDRVPYVRTLRFLLTPELTTRMAQLRTGEVEIIEGVSGPTARQLEGESGINIITSPATAILFVRYFEPQEGNEPWTDRRLREALTISIDQQSIIDGLLQQGQRAPNIHSWPGSRAYDENKFPPRDHDPERARSLIQEAGLNGFSFTVHAYESSSFALITQVMTAIAGAWEQLGLRPELRQWESGAYFTSYTSRALDGVGAQSWPFDRNDDALVLNAYRTGSPYGNTDNFEELDSIAQQILEEADPERQIELTQEAHQFVYDEYLFGTAAYGDSEWATSDKVSGWIRPTGNPYMTRLESARLSS